LIAITPPLTTGIAGKAVGGVPGVELDGAVLVQTQAPSRHPRGGDSRRIRVPQHRAVADAFLAHLDPVSAQVLWHHILLIGLVLLYLILSCLFSSRRGVTRSLAG
jgi:hypothetical protein